MVTQYFFPTDHPLPTSNCLYQISNYQIFKYQISKYQISKRYQFRHWDLFQQVSLEPRSTFLETRSTQGLEPRSTLVSLEPRSTQVSLEARSTLVTLEARLLQRIFLNLVLDLALLHQLTHYCLKPQPTHYCLKSQATHQPQVTHYCLDGLGLLFRRVVLLFRLQFHHFYWFQFDQLLASRA